MCGGATAQGVGYGGLSLEQTIGDGGATRLEDGPAVDEQPGSQACRCEVKSG